MGFASQYLEKQSTGFWPCTAGNWPYSSMVVIIPCFNEPELGSTLQSLAQCQPPQTLVSVLVVINQHEGAEASIRQQNAETLLSIEQWKASMPAWLNLVSTPVLTLPEKHAGAGLARKIGMDCAVAHFNQFNHPKGLIVSLDADCTVDSNYFKALEAHFEEAPQHIAACIHFEHPLETAPARDAMLRYELSLRYYRNALVAIAFPHALYTIGSCFAVKADAYVAQGGMNRRKAGEDFYFLHKLDPLGPIGNITNTTVYPSARYSDRVPFGTGPALQRAQNGSHHLSYTYPLSLFETLKAFFLQIDAIYIQSEITATNQHHVLFLQFCDQMKVLEALAELRKNCSSPAVFRKRFFHVFNAFTIIKWLNFALRHGIEKEDLLDSAVMLANQYLKLPSQTFDPEKLLKFYRAFDKADRIV